MKSIAPKLIVSSLVALSTISSSPSHLYGADGVSAQDETIAIYDNFDNAIENGTLSSSSKLVLSDRSINYLSAVYLYCTLKNGACPVVLESILETDIINSQRDGAASCPNMLRFWKVWVNNGLEQRVDYSLSTGFITKYFEFKRSVRPKFLKCSASVKEELTPDTPFETYVKTRYSKESEHRKTIQTVAGYLKALKEQVPDIFAATGAYAKEPKESTKKWQ